LKLKKIISILCAAALICSISVTVYAATADSRTNDKSNSTKSTLGFNSDDKSSRFEKGTEPELTDEQKAEMEAKRAEMLEEIKARLAQELADGKITQEQYDEKIAAIENGKMHGMRGSKPGFKGEKPELTDEQKAEMEAKRAEMLEEIKAHLAQELADGKITQEQYDEKLAAIENGEMHGMRGSRPGCKGEKPELTDEQKAEMETRRTEMQGNNSKSGFGKGVKGDFERGQGVGEARGNGNL